MRKLFALLAALAAVFALSFTPSFATTDDPDNLDLNWAAGPDQDGLDWKDANLPTGETRTGCGSHGTQVCPILSEGYAKWYHNPSNEPRHWIAMDVEYGSLTNIASNDWVGFQTRAVGPIKLKLICGPDDPTKWDFTYDNSVNGTNLTWGGIGPNGDYNLKGSRADGGNIVDCSTPNIYNMNIGAGGGIDPSQRLPQIRWTFTAHYGHGWGNDTVSVRLTMLNDYVCGAEVISGPGAFYFRDTPHGQHQSCYALHMPNQ